MNKKSNIVRISVSLPREMLDELDQAMKKRRYPGRSEAIREAIRRWLGGE
ncbi:MAG: CopG family ribbon-helix-helix protein [Candidatus Bathyarchaeia archaeon]